MSSVVDEFSILFFCVPVHPDPKPLPNTGLHVAASPSNPSAVSAANSVAGAASAGGSSDNDAMDEDDEDMANDHVSFAI